MIDPRIAALTQDVGLQRQIAGLLEGRRQCFLSVKEAAPIVGVGRRTIERALEHGELRRWRPSPGRVYVERSELIEWFSKKYPLTISVAELAELAELGGVNALKT